LLSLLALLVASCVPTPAGDEGPLATPAVRVTAGQFIPGIAARDFDGDGIDDLVVADPYAGDYPGLQAGQVRILKGPAASGAWTGLPSLLVLSGSEPYRHFGTGLCTGDLDGDGRPDLVIRADASPEGRGLVDVVSGALAGGRGLEASAFLSLAGPYSLGHAMLAMDWNHDGHEDLVVSCPLRSEVYVVFGPRAGALSLPDDADVAVSAGTGSLGWALAWGDYDGDGLADVAMTEPVGETVYLVRTGSSGRWALDDLAFAVLNSASTTDHIAGADTFPCPGGAADGLVVRGRYTTSELVGTVFVLDGPLSGVVDLRTQSRLVLNEAPVNLGVAAAVVRPPGADAEYLALGMPGNSRLPGSSLKGGVWLIDARLAGVMGFDAAASRPDTLQVTPEGVGVESLGTDLLFRPGPAAGGPGLLYVTGQSTVLAYAFE
jgi:hypothetical protein